ncbi:MAG: ATP synthase F1 subunit epsilon [Candidatus Dormibacteraeota bacterium]|nr:ATP synthase F1 subunit epsilon [Candidatus Dormibacteraeota bacterium]
MAPTYRLHVLTVEGELYRTDDAEFTVLPGADGELGILDRHVPLVVTLKPGPLTITHGSGEDEVLFVAGGFADISRDPEGKTVVAVLADSGERAADVDEAAAEEMRRRAQEMLAQKLSDEDYAEAAALLERSIGRIRVAEISRRRRPARSERAMRG